MLKGEVILNPRVKDMGKLLALDGDDMKRIVERVDSTFRQQSVKLFATEGGSANWAWPDLSEDYKKRKATLIGRGNRRRRVMIQDRESLPATYREGAPAIPSLGTMKIMQLTGKLRRSLTEKGGDHIAVGYTVPTATVELGTANPIAAYHAPGPLHNPKLPKRNTVDRSREQMLELSGRIKEYLVTVKMPRIARYIDAGMKVVSMGRGAQAGRARA